MFDENYTQRIWLERKISDSEIAGRFGDLRLPGADDTSVSLGWGGTIVLRQTTKKGVEVREVPLLLRVPKSNSPKDVQRLSDAYLAQLALRCALLGSPDGVLALVFPHSGYQTLCWRVAFRDQDATRTRLVQRLREILTAIQTSQPSRLPTCPFWVRSDCGEGCLCPAPPERGAIPSSTAS
jgi:hypothetical protein